MLGQMRMPGNPDHIDAPDSSKLQADTDTHRTETGIVRLPYGSHKS